MYVADCLKSKKIPKCAKTFGWDLKHCFPKATSNTSRCKSGAWAIYSQTYHNLSLHCSKDDPREWTSKTKIENGLTGYDATVTETQEGFTIAIKCSVQCKGKPLTYSVLINVDLTVPLWVSKKLIDLGQHKISTSLVVLNGQNIQILLRSILSMNMCLPCPGQQSEHNYELDNGKRKYSKMLAINELCHYFSTHINS